MLQSQAMQGLLVIISVLSVWLVTVVERRGFPLLTTPTKAFFCLLKRLEIIKVVLLQ